MTGRATNIQRILFSGIMTVLLIAPTVWAQPSGEGLMKPKDMEERGSKHFIEMCEKLKFSKEQQAKLEKNRDNHKVEFDALMAQMSAKREELRKVLESLKLDRPKVMAIHSELKVLMNKQEDQHLAAILEIREILTPEQFVQFQKMAPDRKGPPPGPPPGPPHEEGDR